MIKNKKGELTTQQIVMLIILITSFAVILFFLFRLNLGEVSNKEICHNSVVLKGKSPVSGNLDCRTNYLCISSGGKCERINPTQTIEVDLTDETQVLKAIADEMVDCWWMFGEGKVNYEGADWKGYHCAVCSIVEFDKNIEVDISYDDLFEFLEKNKTDESQTYLKYLFGVFKSSDFVDKSDYLKENYDDSFSFDEKYSIITGINPEFVGPDAIIPVYFIKTSDLTEEITSCNVFDITKA